MTRRRSGQLCAVAKLSAGDKTPPEGLVGSDSMEGQLIHEAGHVDYALATVPVGTQGAAAMDPRRRNNNNNNRASSGHGIVEDLLADLPPPWRLQMFPRISCPTLPREEEEDN